MNSNPVNKVMVSWTVPTWTVMNDTSKYSDEMKRDELKARIPKYDRSLSHYLN